MKDYYAPLEKHFQGAHSFFLFCQLLFRFMLNANKFLFFLYHKISIEYKLGWELVLGPSALFIVIHRHYAHLFTFEQRYKSEFLIFGFSSLILDCACLVFTFAVTRRVMSCIALEPVRPINKHSNVMVRHKASEQENAVRLEGP